MNYQPRDDLEIDDERPTRARLRETERFMLNDTTSRWTIFARATASGELVGFTEAYLDDARPDLARQGNTGVFPAHRGHGIGRWLKTAMLLRLLEERPGLHLVRTENADSNAAMQSINQGLGFEPYTSICVWQVPIDAIEAYLRTTNDNET